jgi:threonine synthase
MRYVSTRGGAAPVGFLDALLNGLAPDGGLYVPEAWPTLDPMIVKAAATAPYHRTAAAVLKLFAGEDLTLATCEAIATRAYGGQWAHPAVAPLRQTGPGEHVLELTHGPSLAFKDVAMQMIAGLYDHVLSARGRRLAVVCATSGDTGGAAVEALKGAAHADVFVLLPAGRVSEVQRRFMTGSGAANVHACVLDGDFDAAQAIVKALFAEVAFCDEVGLSPVNSINWARIVAQSVYYVVAASALSAGGPVHFTVPSGNFGDALAGHVAKRIGAPVGRIMIATNANDGIARAFATGRYAKTAASTATLSPAMDISVASNFERIMFEAVDRDPVRLKPLYDAFAQSGAYAVPEDALAFLTLHFDARGVDDGETRAAIRNAHESTGEVLCPHTAVGWHARFGPDDVDGARVLLATAHPAKFPETVTEVLGAPPPLPAHCADLFEREERFVALPAEVGAVKAAIRAALAPRAG